MHRINLRQSTIRQLRTGSASKPSCPPPRPSHPTSTHLSRPDGLLRSAVPTPLRASRSSLRATTELGKLLAPLASLGFHQGAHFIAISSDRRHAVSRSEGSKPHAREDPDTRVWDLESSSVIWTGNLGSFAALSVAVDYASGRYVFCSGCKLLVWPMDEEHQKPFTIDSDSTYPRHQGLSVAVATDGVHAVSVGDMELKIWDLQRKCCIASVIGSIGPVTGVSLSLDRRFAAVAASEPEELQVWDLQARSGATGSCIGRLPGKHDWASFAVTADRRYAVSSCADAKQGLQLWSLGVSSYTVVHPLSQLRVTARPVRAAAVSGEQGERVVVVITGDTDSVTEVHTWDVRPWWQRLLGILHADPY